MNKLIYHMFRSGNQLIIPFRWDDEVNAYECLLTINFSGLRD